MLKTATITWNSFYNYGTCLQAYALQRYILSLGYENQIIDDSTIVYEGSSLSKKLQIIKKWEKRWIKLWQSFHTNYRLFYKYQRILCPSINRFKLTCLKIDYNIDSVLDDSSDYDVYICGSDQIWSPAVLDYPRGTFYFATFTKKRKIAYAPSIGRYDISDIIKKPMVEFLKSFSALSVREEAGQQVIQKMTSKEVELVVDPTLLISKQEWNMVLPQKRISNEKYILGYILTPNLRFYKIARDYAQRHGMKFYLFMLNLEDYGQADQLVSGGPFDFLRYICNAKMVFTDSYHGTIFATILETPFYTFKRFSDDSPINQNSRIETLLNNMGAETRLIDGQLTEQLSDDTPDFREMKRRLEPLIEHSKEYLKTNLSAIEESLNK